jgi:hypothetical protein
MQFCCSRVVLLFFFFHNRQAVVVYQLCTGSSFISICYKLFVGCKSP